MDPIDSLYNMSNYTDRFRFHLSKVNPKYFFISNQKILEADKELKDYQTRLSLAQ